MITRLNTIVLISLFSAVQVRAAITVQHFWGLGETSPVTDSAGGATLTMTGSPASVAGTYSVAALDFTNTASESPAGQYLSYTGALSASLTGSTNWGLDFYVKPDFLPNGTTNLEVGLLHLGGTGGNSLAIELGSHPTWADGTVNWMVHQPGSAIANLNVSSGGVLPPVTGIWSHVVYVNNGGTGELYVDGVKANIAVPAVTGPDTSSGAPGLAIGAMWSDYRRGFDGQLDQVRLFTFVPGGFDIADTVPEPAGLALAGLAATGFLRRRRR